MSSLNLGQRTIEQITRHQGGEITPGWDECPSQYGQKVIGTISDEKPIRFQP
jgi:hypothetical protein